VSSNTHNFSQHRYFYYEGDNWFHMNHSSRYLTAILFIYSCPIILLTEVGFIIQFKNHKLIQSLKLVLCCFSQFYMSKEKQLSILKHKVLKYFHYYNLFFIHPWCTKIRFNICMLQLISALYGGIDTQNCQALTECKIMSLYLHV
jgi:hypothetical protein